MKESYLQLSYAIIQSQVSSIFPIFNVYPDWINIGKIGYKVMFRDIPFLAVPLFPPPTPPPPQGWHVFEKEGSDFFLQRNRQNLDPLDFISKVPTRKLTLRISFFKGRQPTINRGFRFLPFFFGGGEGGCR